MKPWQAWLPLSLTLLSGGADAATEVGAVTLLEGSGRLLRGATWYKLVTGARLEEADILEVADKTQAQVEFKAGSTVNLFGGATLYLAPAKGKNAPTLLVLPGGWFKAVAKAPGLQLRTPLLEVTAAEGILVLHATKASVDFFVESGEGRVVEVMASGADGPSREARRGEYFSRAAAGSITSVARAPRAFVEGMPRPYIDALPALAGRLKSPRCSPSTTRSRTRRPSRGSPAATAPCSSGASRRACATPRSGAL